MRKQEKQIPKSSDISYFRNKVENISPGVLSFLMNRKIKFEDTIMGAIFSLIHKKYLKIENNELVVLENDEEQLDLNEKFILSYRKSLFTDINFPGYWEEYIVKDAIENGYVKENENKLSGCLIMIGFLFAIASMFLFLVYQEAHPDLGQTTLAWTLFMGHFFLIVVNLMIYMRMFTAFENYYKYIRTEKGQELYVKLIGLKNFLRDFSNISQSQKEELYLWEEYMIYVILFDLPGLLDYQVQKQFDDLRKAQSITFFAPKDKK